MTVFTYNVIKLLVVTASSALVGFAFAPMLDRFLHKIKFWKKEARQKTITGEEANVFYSLHKEREVTVPRGGGIIIWISVLSVMAIAFLLNQFSSIWWLKNLNFVSRPETWLPLFALVTASLVGFFDDLLVVNGKGKYVGKGMDFWRRLAIVILIGLIGGWWFYAKLGWDKIHLPLLVDFPVGIDIAIGWLVIPFFALVSVASFSGGIIDGIDGLSGGVFATIFGAFAIIAFSQGKVDLAVFCGAIVGALFAFLWFNIPPARFYMGETGALGLTMTMAVTAFLTNSVLVLPLIAGIMVLEVSSSILQLLSKKIRGKKIWLSTPIHHHFEAVGWPPYQITMRFWLIGIVLAILGVAIRLMSYSGVK
ncbi:MAG: hypothetical protein Q8N56_00115 [bacterium]|nr:hypothetical protein [bacterium]